MPINNQWYTEAFRDGMKDAYRVSPERAVELAAECSKEQRDERVAEGILKIMRGESTPYKFARAMADTVEDTPRYRADMIDAGRGRLVR